MAHEEIDNGNIYDDVESMGRAGAMGDFNFWEMNNYKKTVKRLEDGARLCEEFMRMVSERSEIEASYCSKMKAWSKKWEENHKKGPEYGALKTAMYGIMVEGEQLADIHCELKEKLLNEVYQSMNQWKKENYHKTLISYKEVKNADEGFNKAQKPWSRRLDEVHKSKKGYHNSCRSLDSGKKQQEEGKVKGMNDEQLRKIQEKMDRYTQDVISCKERYENALRDLSGYVPKYEEDMKYQFNKCQEAEEGRKCFFESLLMEYQKAVTRVGYTTRMQTIYQSLLETFKKTDTKHDLNWFAEVYGSVYSPLDTPEYEEYDPNVMSPSNRNTSASSSGRQRNNDDNGNLLKPNRSGVCTTL